MSFSILSLAGNGTSTYSISFTLGYLDRSEVTCQVNGAVDGSGNPVYSALTWVSDGVVTVAGGPYTSSDTLVFRRTMSKTTLIHDYTDGEIINESNLDETAEQAIMISHELLDGRFTSPFQQDLDMGGFKIVNLGAPVNATDAARNEDAATIAANITAITAVAADLTAINAVDADLSNINSVQADLTNINSVATDLTNINSVASDLTNIDAVHSNASNINTVAGISTNVTTVAGISANVSTVAGVSANVTTVASDTTNINSVATSISNVNSVASDLTNINAVHSDLTNIDLVAADLTNIDACAGDLTAINNAPTQASNAASSASAAAISATAAAAAANSVANSWLFDSTTTMSAPGTGKLRLNNATLSSVTAIAIEATSNDSGNPNLHPYIITWDDSSHSPAGLLHIEDASGNFAIFKITSGGISDNTSWLQLTVTTLTSSGSFTNGNALYAQFSGYGNDGTGSGDTSTNTSTSVVGEGAVFADTSGKLLKRFTGSGFVKALSGVLSVVTSIVEGDFGFTDITTANVSTSAHGLCPKLPNDSTKYLNGVGSYAVPASGISKVTTQVFTSGSGTYTPTSGMKYCIVEVQAAGGNGGTGGSSKAGSGGGSGEYRRKTYDAATIGASQAYSIGAVGSNTTFGSTLISAVCGSSGSTVISSPGIAGGNGGTGGSGGDFVIAGCSGDWGSYGASGYYACSGRGADSMLGHGGGATLNGNGNNASGYGAGGAGAGGYSGTNSAGSGTGGIIIITEFQ